MTELFIVRKPNGRPTGDSFPTKPEAKAARDELNRKLRPKLDEDDMRMFTESGRGYTVSPGPDHRRYQA